MPSMPLDMKPMEIEVSAILLDKKDLDPDLPIGNENAWDQYVRIDIRDNGCGMSPDVLKQIFDPFFTTKKVEKEQDLGWPLQNRSSLLTEAW